MEDHPPYRSIIEEVTACLACFSLVIDLPIDVLEDGLWLGIGAGFGKFGGGICLCLSFIVDFFQVSFGGDAFTDEDGFPDMGSCSRWKRSTSSLVRYLSLFASATEWPSQR
jgi:hypothetical protein